VVKAKKPKSSKAFQNFVNRTKTPILLIITVVVTTLFCVVMTLFQGLVPQRFIEKNVDQSLQQLYSEETYPEILGQKIDNFTNRVMIQETNNSLILPKNAGTEFSERESVEGKNKIQRIFFAGSYDRYWHGYRVYLKPLLMLFDYNGIRIVMAITFLALFVLSVWRINKKISPFAALAFLIAIVVSNPESIIMGTQHFSIYLILFLAIIVLTRIIDKPNKNKLIPIFFVVVGGLTCFIDFLTTPLITLGVPLLLILIHKAKQKNYAAKFVPQLRDFFACSLSWMLGYVFIWISKWLITSLLLGENRMIMNLKQVLFWASGETSIDSCDRMCTVLLNTERMPIVAILGMVAIFVLIVAVIKMKKRNFNLFKLDIVLLLVSVMPIVWFLIANNHSQVHYWMTYRILGVSVLAFLLVIYRQLNFIRGNSYDKINL
jgi:hypothetical protein